MSGSGKRKRGGDVKFYSVRVGKAPGVYHSWDECLEQVKGFKGAIYKSFPSLTDAEKFVKSSDPLRSSVPKKASSTQKFYGVRRGYAKGVYTDWPTVQEQITGYHKPEYKSFATRWEAENFVRGDLTDATNSEPSAKKSRIFEELPPGLGPLPPGAEDGFDHTLTLDTTTGKIRKKTSRELNATKAVPRVGPASTGEWTIIYTDGACTSNGKKGARAGVGVWFGPNHPYNVSERLPGERQTNQRAELTALKRALNMCPMNRNAHIFSDSHYAIKCVTEWFPNWEKRGWKNSQGKPVENRDIVEEILELIRDRESCKGKTKFEWVKGHSGDAGNEAADSLAVKGITATLPAVTRDQTAEEIAAASLEVDESET